MSVIAIDRPSDRIEWLKARHPFFNASDAGALYSAHPFRDLADVAVEKLRVEPPNDEPTEAMERGQRLEPVLLDWFADRNNVTVVSDGPLYANGRLSCTPDGEIVGNEDEWIQAKTTREYWHSTPSHVYWQITAEAAASGKRRCHLVWLDASMRLQSVVIVPPAEHQEDVLARAEQFMAFIDMGMTPEGVQLSAEHVLHMFPKAEVGTWVTLDDDGRDAVLAWEEARLERLAAEKREKTLKAPLAGLLSGAEGGKFNGLPIITWRNNKDGEGFVVGEHETAEPECHAKYTRTTKGARVMRATKELRTFEGVKP